MKDGKKSKVTPPLNDEDYVSKGIAAARRLALKQLEAGTASSQTMQHFLELGTMRERAKIEKMAIETELLKVRMQSEQAAANSQQAAEEALEALKQYTVQPYE